MFGKTLIEQFNQSGFMQSGLHFDWQTRFEVNFAFIGFVCLHLEITLEVCNIARK